MQTEWMDGVVSDYVSFSFTPFPLPYHTHAYQVNQLVPFFMDLCIADATQCFNDQYRDFSYENLSNVLSLKDMAQNEFEDYWAGEVSAALGVDQDLVASAYDKSSPNSTDGA